MRRAWNAGWRAGLLPVVAGGAGVLGVLWLVLVVAPPWFVQHRSLEVAKAQNDVRTTLLQGLGGAVLLVGAYFTYRQVTNSREQLRIAQQGQITERFTRTVDQLGHTQLDVRLGGIYALERISRDSPADQTTIGEVLTAFVRSHAPWPPSLPGQYVAAAPIDEVPELQVRAPDVQASLTVLGRGGFARPAGHPDRLDLHAVDLRHANLSDAHLEGTYLVDAHLEGAKLIGVHLESAYLMGVHLEGAVLGTAFRPGQPETRWPTILKAHLEQANLQDAHLQDADLSGAHLERAYLIDAHLEGADLSGAHLEGAYASGVHLEGADLRGADLEHTYLVGAHLEGALADDKTALPVKFDLPAAGIIVSGEDTAANGP